MKRPPWVTRDGDDAFCSRCGGKSHFVFMYKWRPNSNFTYWHWWDKFKKTHKNCIG